MKYTLTNGRLATMSLDQPKEDLTREDVEPVMQSIIDMEALRVKEAKAAAIKSAIIREVSETKLI